MLGWRTKWREIWLGTDAHDRRSIIGTQDIDTATSGENSLMREESGQVFLPHRVEYLDRDRVLVNFGKVGNPGRNVPAVAGA